jgi:hypothetical protein
VQVTESLQQCNSSLAGVTLDADGDGIYDSGDDCLGTPPAVEVDRMGCSAEQFCGTISVADSVGRRTCRRSDWKNDEALMRSRYADCTIDRVGLGVEDDRCIPVLN